MDAREKLNEFAELRVWDKNKLIGWSEAADFGEWLVKNCSISDVSKRFDKVHVVIEAKSEDYHGTYNEIIQIFSNLDDADKKVKELSETNYKGNIEYFIDTWNVD